MELPGSTVRRVLPIRIGSSKISQKFGGLDRYGPVLEIGCGAGHATRGFAQRGLNIVAIDPGAELLRVARQNLFKFHNVEFVQATFEAWRQASAVFSLVASAQAFHWVAPEVRFIKSADVLRPRGTLAIFGNVPVGITESLLDEFRRIYSSHGFPTDRPPGENWYLPSGGIAELFARSKRFEPVEHRKLSLDMASHRIKLHRVPAHAI
jgi:SAM-dependent methyltransferase